MQPQSEYVLVADALLVAHTCIVLFVVLGLPLILVGAWLKWAWIRNRWFRIAHLGAIGVVMLQSWAGMICPLTTWEMQLRAHSGNPTYEGSFIGHWLSEIIYWQAPGWVFTLAYTAFGMAVAAAWLWIRPRPFSTQGSNKVDPVV